jgi:hypothetical protein
MPESETPSVADADSSDWYYLKNDQSFGPFSSNDMAAALEDGVISPDDLVWHSSFGDEGWCSASQLVVVDKEEDLVAPAQATAPDMREPLSDDAGDSLEFAESVMGDGSGPHVCPYCWYHFEEADLLFIAENENLMNDPVAGNGEMLRFSPRYFTPDGKAIDPRGTVCENRACPRCHQRIPAPYLEYKPLFISIVGAPGSGKTNFLPCATRRLGERMWDLGANFAGADSELNSWVLAYESLFFDSPPDIAVRIPKTEPDDINHYRNVRTKEMSMRLPVPCMFTMLGDTMQRTLVMHDNAGEHFEQGLDSVAAPVTRHLVLAEAIFFMFDPTLDVGFQTAYADKSEDPQMRQLKTRNQVTLFATAIQTIQRVLGLPSRRYDRPVVVLISKADALGDDMTPLLSQEPLRWSEEQNRYEVDLGMIMNTSFACREMIAAHSPVTVSTVESLASDVVFMPVSALGCTPFQKKDDPSGDTYVRPRDVNPRWVLTPFVYVLARLGNLPNFREADPDTPVLPNCRFLGNEIRYRFKTDQPPRKAPVSYAGTTVWNPEQKNWCRLPYNAQEADQN